MPPDSHSLLGPWASYAREAILAIGRDGRVAAWNPAATGVLGYEADDALGRHFGFVLPERYSQRDREQLLDRMFADDPETAPRELQLAHAAGHELPVAVSVTSFAAHGERFAAMRFEDITDRKRLDVELMRLASYPELNPNPIFEVDLDGEVTYQNDPARALAETGWIAAVLDRLGDPSRLEVGSEQRFIDELEVAGTWYDLHVHPVIGWDRVRVYSRDITERKQAEAALIATRDELAERSRELEREVEERKRAQQRAVEAARAKAMFLSYMSHELRTPLTAIIGYAQLLGEELTSDEARADLAMIESSASELVEIISDVLDLSKVEAGRMEVRAAEVEVARLLDDVMPAARGLMLANGNEFVARCEPGAGLVHTDAVKVRQILLNLIGNAAKFTRAGRIALSAQRVQSGGRDWVELAVADTGIGMKPETVDGLFEPFSQAESLTTRRFRGTGLGLAICREFCELLGGSIRATSRYGEGSTFTVRLPARTPGRGTVAEPAAQVTPAGR